MPVSDDYITYTLDLLSDLGSLRIKRMFGGAGVYCGELYFAILVDDELYFKVDDHNRGDYERLGLKPFTYAMKNGSTSTMNYYPVPVDVIEDVEQLTAWAEKALEASRRSKRKPRK